MAELDPIKDTLNQLSRLAGSGSPPNQSILPNSDSNQPIVHRESPSNQPTVSPRGEHGAAAAAVTIKKENSEEGTLTWIMNIREAAFFFFFFLVHSPLREGGGKGLSTKEKRTFFNVFLSFFVLLTSKPRGVGLKALLDCPLRKKNFLWIRSIQSRSKSEKIKKLNLDFDLK